MSFISSKTGDPAFLSGSTFTPSPRPPPVGGGGGGGGGRAKPIRQPGDYPGADIAALFPVVAGVFSTWNRPALCLREVLGPPRARLEACGVEVQGVDDMVCLAQRVVERAVGLRGTTTEAGDADDISGVLRD